MGLFTKKNKEEEDNNLENNSLDIQVEEALRKAKNDKRETEKDIEKIKSWMAEAIVETYVSIFPNGHLSYYREQYKEDAIKNYDKIKKENSDKIPKEEAEKCDKILQAYLNQISLRESKLKLFDKLIAEYEKTKQKLKDLAKEQKKGDKFLKHSERLNSLDEHSETLSDAMIETDHLENIKREFELKAEYVKQLEKLNLEYSDDVEHDNALAFKDEIEKITEKLDENQ